MIKENEIQKRQLALFGRSFALLLNRSFMYSANHPFQIEAVNSTYKSLSQLTQNQSSTVFILNGEKFYVDDEPLDPRLSVSKISAYFKRTGLESISFYKGIEKKELQIFLEIATSPNKYPDADAMKKALFKRRIANIKINHVYYKKVSAEDEVVSRDILDKVTPEIMGEQQEEVKQMFMDSIFNSVLQEEFIKNLNLDNLLENPGDLSKKMIAADLTTVKHYENKNLKANNNEALSPGQFLLHQLQIIDQDVERNLSDGKVVELPIIADAIFDMRQKLVEGIEAQKSLGVAYANEEDVYSKATEITDKVVIRLIREEYKSGETTVFRLAQILCRLIPEAGELKRMLPKIKSALLEEGMSQEDFISLIRELGKVLQDDGLVNILSESAEEIGIDGDELIQQVRENPLKSAEMIYLASEIRKRGGDEKALTDLIVNYVDQIGSRYSKDLRDKNGEEGEKLIQRAFKEVRTNLVQHLDSLDIEDDLLIRLEERVNRRMDDVFNKLRSEWIKSHSASNNQKIRRELTVLETLEQSASEDQEAGQILKVIREKVESGEIDENDFDEIYAEIIKQQELRKSHDQQKSLVYGILRERMLMTYLDKEVARARRFKTSLSVLGFTLVKAKAINISESEQISTRDVMDALLYKLVEIFRTPDIVGEVRKNHFIVLLPMTHEGQANLALRRTMKILHLNPLDIGGVSVEIKVAGVVADNNRWESPDAGSLVERLATQLKDMAKRINTLHAYS